MKKEEANPEQQPAAKFILESSQYDYNASQMDYTLKRGPDLLHYIS